jgi:hypothetical protein
MNGEQHESQAAGMPTLRFHGYGGGSGGERAPRSGARWAGLNEGHQDGLSRQDGTAPFKGQLPVFGEEANHAQPSRKERLEQTLD